MKGEKKKKKPYFVTKKRQLNLKIMNIAYPIEDKKNLRKHCKDKVFQ